MSNKLTFQSKPKNARFRFLSTPVLLQWIIFVF